MSRFFQQLGLGIKIYWDSLIFIRANGLWTYFIFPAVLSFLIWFVAYSIEQTVIATDYSQVNSLKELLILVISNMFWTSLVLMGYKLRKYIVFIVLSPLLAKLSQRTEEIITGNSYSYTLVQYKNDIIRAIRIALGNFLVEYFIFALWYIIVIFVPSFSVATPAVLFLVGCYFYGFCFIDYVNERRRLNIEESVEFVRKHFGFSFGLGVVFSAFFFIPYDLGVLIAPVLGIVAGTLGMHLLVDLSKNEYASKADLTSSS